MKIRTRPLPRPPNEAASTRAAPPRLDTLTGKPLPPRGAKFNNQPCEDLDGNKYQSQAERTIHLAFAARADAGECTAPARGVYRFRHTSPNGKTVLIGKYTSDVEFTALRDFPLQTPAARYEFIAGQRYVIDVKSPASHTTATALRLRLMLAFHDIAVLIVYTRKPKAKKKAVSTRDRAKSAKD